MLRLPGLTSVAVALLTASACARFASDPGRKIVAEVGEAQVTASALSAYLEANQVSEAPDEPPAPGDVTRVKSRLFDDFLDGEVLYQEARRRGVMVTDAELADYVGKEVPMTPAAKDLARRDLTIQKLRESVVLENVHVDDREIDAWIAAHPVAEPALAGTLRTLRLASYPEALRVRKEIVAKKLAFADAEVAYGADSLSDTPGDEEIDALPPQIAAAAKAMTPGTVSQPLPYESSVLLFLLEPEEDPQARASRRRDAARRAISLEKSQNVADNLLKEVKARTKVIRHLDNLPFTYVAEDPASHPQ